jgi:hypothetical protein
VGAVGALALLAIGTLYAGGRLTATAAAPVLLLAAFVAGVAMQLRLGSEPWRRAIHDSSSAWPVLS